MSERVRVFRCAKIHDVISFIAAILDLIINNKKNGFYFFCYKVNMNIKKRIIASLFVLKNNTFFRSLLLTSS